MARRALRVFIGAMPVGGQPRVLSLPQRPVPPCPAPPQRRFTIGYAASSAASSPSSALLSLFSSLKQRLLHRLVRPLVRRAPTGVWIAAARVASWAAGPLLLWRKGAHLGRVLLLCGRADSLPARLGLASAAAYQRLRRMDYYLHEGVRDVRIDWSGAPASGPCCLVLMDTCGAEQLDHFLRVHPSWVVRRRFDGEGQVHADSAPPGQRWSAHCAQLRGRINAGRVVDVGRSSMGLRGVINGADHVVVFQGFMQPPGDRDERAFLGQRVSMPLGAVRLARRAGLPLRFLRVMPVGSHWEVVIEPEMPADEAALVARMERALREQPQSWTLWTDFLAAVDAPAASATAPAGSASR